MLLLVNPAWGGEASESDVSLITAADIAREKPAS